METNPVLVFDDGCLMCNKWVKFILRFEKKEELLFVALSSVLGQHINAQKATSDETFIFSFQNKILIKSEAVLEVSKYLKLPFSWIQFLRIIPLSWRDGIYDFVARNRYRVFKPVQCDLPNHQTKHRFITA